MRSGTRRISAARPGAYTRCVREWFPGSAGVNIAPTLLYRTLAERGRGPRTFGARLRSHRVCFFPALHRAHWTLVVVVPANETVYVADSLVGGGVDTVVLPGGFWDALRDATRRPWQRAARVMPCHQTGWDGSRPGSAAGRGRAPTTAACTCSKTWRRCTRCAAGCLGRMVTASQTS